MGTKKHPASTAAFIKLHLALPFISYLESRGLDCEETLSQFDLNRAQMDDETVLVASKTMYRLLNALADMADEPALAVMIGEKLDLTAWPLMTEATANAVTIGDFFIRFIAQTRNLASKIEYQLEIKGETARFRLIRAEDPGFCPQQADSFYIGLFYNIFTCLMGSEWDHGKVSMQVCEPRVVPDNYHDLKIYNCDNTGFRFMFPAEWLSRSIALHSKRNECKSSPTEDMPPAELIEAIQRVLKQHIHLAELDASRAAQFCGFAPRKFARLLKQHGLAINQLIAQLREQEATRLLLETERSITEVAMAVGFHDLSSFSRSFKRWTGESPREFRQKQRTRQQ